MADDSNSIFLTIKTVLGVESSFSGFDSELLLGINSAIMNLVQLGVGPSAGFKVTGQTETWTDLIGDFDNLEGAKTYVQLKVRLIFDPPSNSFVLDALNREVQELGWRLKEQAEINAAESSGV